MPTIETPKSKIETPPTRLPSEETIALRRLDNGLLLAAYENFASPAVTLSSLLAAGAMDEPPEKSGLASLTAALLSRGTTQRDYDALNETIEGVGASVHASSGTHTSGVSAKSLAEDFPDILSLVAEQLRHPTFPEEHLERVRAQRVTALHERLNNTRAVADLRWDEAAYPPDHPYHYPTSGTPDTVAALSRDDLVRFHETTYGPAGGILLVVGAMAQAEALDRLEAAFGDWQPLAGHDPDRDAPDVAWPSAPLTRREAMSGKTQSDIVYGLPTIARTHPDFTALQLANVVLGVFGMMGRIGRSVRDEQGLAYYASSSLAATRGPGAWSASAGVAPENVERAVASIRDEWERMQTELVPEDELNDSKALVIGSLPLRLETNGGIARTILDLLYYDLGLDYLLAVGDRIHAISAEEIRRVSQAHFDPDRAILAVAGPGDASP